MVIHHFGNRQQYSVSDEEGGVMIITRKAISRRTMLRGLGVTLGLPLLDAMVPALTALAKTAAKPVTRFGAIYIPNGVLPGSWYPQTEGSAFEFSPTLKPLEPFRDRLLVLSGLDSTTVPQPGDPPYIGVANNHEEASTRFLTDMSPKNRALRAGVSMDQIAANVLGKSTQLPSLELALESIDSGSTCGSGKSCVYTGTISWAGTSAPLPMEHDPSAVFERMFGDSETTDPTMRRSRMQKRGSILDSVLGEVSQLQNELGAQDRSRVTAYLDSVREVEQRIQKTIEHNTEVPVVERPAGIPPTFEQHIKLMFDLQVLAYQSDVTRVITFMIGREFSGRTYPEIGVPDAHHPISHHQKNPERMERVAKINQYHVSMFSYYVKKLATTMDGDGSLLDNSVILYGAGMSEGNGHFPENLPLLLVGGAAGKVKGGRHIRSAKGTPLANLHMALLDKLEAPVERIGNSTGSLDLA
jgi:hypothetical protein